MFSFFQFNKSPPINSPEPSLWEKCHRQLLTPAATPVLQYKKSRVVFDLYIQSSSDRLELEEIIRCMRQSLNDCMETIDLTLAENEFSNAAIFAEKYTYAELYKCRWADSTIQTSATAFYIASVLSELASEAGWALFNNIQQHNFLIKHESSNEFMSDTLRLNLINLAINDVNAHLRFVEHLMSEHDRASSDIKNTQWQPQIETVLSDLETKVDLFQEKMDKSCVFDCDDDCVNFIDKTRFLSFAKRARLAIIREDRELTEYYLGKCNWLKIKHINDHLMRCEFGELVKLFQQLKLSLDENAKSSVEDIQEVTSQQTRILKKSIKQNKHHAPDNVPQKLLSVTEKPSLEPSQAKLAREERERERRRLKREAKLANRELNPVDHDDIAGGVKERSDVPSSLYDDTSLTPVATSQRSFTPPTDELIIEINQKPACYQNLEWLKLIRIIRKIFVRSLCNGYLFGSANYKEEPNDLDILIPDIQSDEPRLEALFRLFEDKGWKEATSGKRTLGKRGYVNKSGQHVVPMEKEIDNQIKKIDFIVTNKSISEHAENLDITLGAMYFSLRESKMYCLKSHTSFCEEEQKIVHTDYKNKTINTILDPILSFTNDPIRIFRVIRLDVTKKFSMSSACEDGIKQVFSNESNLFKKMNSKNLDDQLSLICRSGHEIENITKLHDLDLLFKLYLVLSERTDPVAPRFINGFKEICPALTGYWEGTSLKKVSQSMPNLANVQDRPIKHSTSHRVIVPLVQFGSFSPQPLKAENWRIQFDSGSAPGHTR